MICSNKFLSLSEVLPYARYLQPNPPHLAAREHALLPLQLLSERSQVRARLQALGARL
jgi:hypothetical protein